MKTTIVVLFLVCFHLMVEAEEVLEEEVSVVEVDE
jgi:hypothetical protein